MVCLFLLVKASDEFVDLLDTVIGFVDINLMPDAINEHSLRSRDPRGHLFLVPVRQPTRSSREHVLDRRSSTMQGR
jgi:hypothetical protein